MMREEGREGMRETRRERRMKRGKGEREEENRERECKNSILIKYGPALYRDSEGPCEQDWAGNMGSGIWTPHIWESNKDTQTTLSCKKQALILQRPRN